MKAHVSKKVNLFLIGAAKCGTTSLHHYLNQHPSIMMAVPKEPFFFEAEFELGADYYTKKYFSHWSGQTVLGDARHRNLYLPFVVSRIKAYAPDDAKFLVILRNPVDRAYSHWWHNYSWGDEKMDFEGATEANLRRLETGPFFESEQDALLYRQTLNFKTGFSPYTSYIDSGFYDEQIQRYQIAFGEEKVKILFLEDLKANPQCVMQSVFEFVGIDTNAVIDFKVENEANSVVGKKILRSLKTLPGRKLLPKSLKSAIYLSIRRHFRPKNERKVFSDDLRKALVEIYEPHISILESMTGRKLDSWRRV